MLCKLSFLIIAISLFGCTSAIQSYDKLEAFDDLSYNLLKHAAFSDSQLERWDSLITQHRSRIQNDMNEEAYFILVSEFLQGLRDPHIWLISAERSMYSIDYMDYNQNVDNTILDTYLMSKVAHSQDIISALLPGNIGYLSCRNFEGNFNSNNKHYSEALERLKDTKGLIIDIRANDGGSLYNSENLLEKLIQDKIYWHATRNKTTNGFDEPYHWYLEPDKSINYSRPIMVLSSRYTISAGERFVLGANATDHIQVIGDTTAGTQGSIMGREMLNGWQYTFTFEKVTDADGKDYAEAGIPPDIYIDPTNSLNENKDLIIEKAIELLNQ